MDLSFLVLRSRALCKARVESSIQTPGVSLAGGEQQDVREGKVPSYVEHYSIFHVSWCNTTLKVFSTPPHALTFTDN